MSNMYEILGKLKSVFASEALTPESTEPLYESVKPNGDIMEAVNSLEAKFKTFKESAKPDFLDVDKDGNKKEPFKKAVKDKKAKKVKEGYDSRDAYDKWDPKHPDFKNNWEEYKAKNPDGTLSSFIAKLKDSKVAEGKFDEPAPIDADAVAKRKRLQALKDRQEDERAERGSSDTNTPIRKVAGKAYGGAAQKDDVSDLDEVAPPGAKAERMVKHIKKGYSKDGNLSKKEKGIAYATAWKAKKAGQVEETDEAPKHYGGQGPEGAEFDLYMQKRKADLEKQRPPGQVEEGCEFSDSIKNSAPNMKKAKPAKLKESRVMEETDYFYEQVAKSLSEKNPHLDTGSDDFYDAVRKEMVAHGIAPNKARNILLMDEDFIMDVASAYGHYCKEVAEDINQSNIPSPTNDNPITAPSNTQSNIPSPTNANPITAPAINSEELDEIARLAGIPTKPAVLEVTELDEAVSRKDFRMVADLIKANPDRVKATELAHHHAGIFAQQNPRFKRDTFLNACGIDSTPEVTVDEGNEYTKARLDAIQSGKDTFVVGGKVHSVSGDVSQEKQQVEEAINVTINASADDTDGVHILQLLAGLQSAEQPAQAIPVAPVAQEIPAGDEGGEVAEERDIEYINTPNEKIAPLSAASPNGTDINKSKRQYPGAANRAANPMAVEESLWKDYESLLNAVKE